DGIRDFHVTGVQTCALPIFSGGYLAPCGIQTDGTGLCWGGAYAPPVPAGTFTAVSSGPMGGDMCWTRADGTITCTTSPFFSGPRSEERREGKMCLYLYHAVE